MKIAFCFLTYDDIIRYDIWNTFFENIDENKYNVFIHPKNIGINITKYKFKYNIIKNRIITKTKDDISIVRATLKLLEDAYEYDKNISHFIFLSQSCIPIYNFDTIYKIIIASQYSIISLIKNNKKDRYNQLLTSFKKYIHINNFVKQQPNMMLIRNDVGDLIRNNYSIYFQHIQCPDEHYFINIMISIFKKKFIKKQIHFCNPDFNRTQALEFNNINKDFIDKIRKYGFLFMRKVTVKSIIDTNYLFL
jgi:hypothetical protein